MHVTEYGSKRAEKDSYSGTIQEYGKKVLPQNHPATLLVKRIAGAIMAKNDLGHIVEPSQGYKRLAPDEWEVYVIHDDKVPNAFVIPGQLFRS